MKGIFFAGYAKGYCFFVLWKLNNCVFLWSAALFDEAFFDRV
jgi:hypothetical protein